MRAVVMTSVVVIIAGLAGCAPKDPMVAWQEGVTRYIERQGHGSISALRDTTDLRSPRSPRPARITIGELDVPVAGSGPFVDMRDVHGVLLGVRRVGTRNWYLFLVAVISRQEAHNRIEDIRLVGLCADSGNMCWSVAESTPAPLARYLARLADNEAPHPARHHLLFPMAEDVFRLDVAGSLVTATEIRSGARWELAIVQPPA